MSHTATHPFTSEQIMAFCDDELSAAEAHSVHEHIAVCAECAEEVNRFRQTSQQLSHWQAPAVSSRIDAPIEERLLEATSSHKRRNAPVRSLSPSRRRWRPWAIGGLGAVAALFLLVVAISVRQNSQKQRLYSFVQPNESVASNDANGQNEPANAYVDSRSARPQAASGLTAVNQLAAPAPGSDVTAPAATNAPLIARSVSLQLVAKDIPAARSALDSILARNHGYAAEITVSTPSDDAPSLKATLRIPAANLTAAIGDLSKLGRVANESESGEDVTQQHADLDQRLKTARETEDRFRGILQQRTANVNDVLQVEEEISRVRGEIESMEAEQKELEHRVDYASIDLSVTAEYSATAGTGSAPLAVRMRNAFIAGYRNALGTIVGIFLFLVEYGPAILIWLAILALPVIFLRRRYRRIHAKI